MSRALITARQQDMKPDNPSYAGTRHLKKRQGVFNQPGSCVTRAVYPDTGCEKQALAHSWSLRNPQHALGLGGPTVSGCFWGRQALHTGIRQEVSEHKTNGVLW